MFLGQSVYVLEPLNLGLDAKKFERIASRHVPLLSPLSHTARAAQPRRWIDYKLPGLTINELTREQAAKLIHVRYGSFDQARAILALATVDLTM
jgi:hypothetical protein